MRISDVIDGRSTVSKSSSKKILSILILITGILSATFILVTIYGQYTGTFVLSLSDEASDRGIEISDDAIFTTPRNSLTFMPLDNAKEFAFSSISQNELVELRKTDGQYNEGAPYYIAYTFYLRNAGTLATEVVFKLRFIQVVNDLNEAVKVHLIHTTVDDIMISNQTYGLESGSDPKKIENWLIGDETLGVLNPKEVRKFSIIVWLNGPDVFEKHVRGAVKMEMAFSIVGEGS